MKDRFPPALGLRSAGGLVDIGRAGLGAVFGMLFAGVAAQLMIGGDPRVAPLLVAPIGASAVLIFAVPASPLAQPRAVICGNVVSALAGITCALLIPNPTLAAPIAVSLAIMLMLLTGCLHPPGGAVALICVIGGPQVSQMGYLFALSPVGLDSLLLTGAGMAYHWLMGRSYPHRAPVPAVSPHGTADTPPTARAGFTAGDLDAALARYGELLDVSRDDLDALFRQVELQAHQRLHAQILCGDIMSTDVIALDPQQTCQSALLYMQEHDLRTAPVVDARRRVLGLARRAELLANRDRKVEVVIDPFVHRVRATTPIQALLPLLSSGAVHEAVVVDADRTLRGIVTQTDLLAVLYRAHVVEAMAAGR